MRELLGRALKVQDGDKWKAPTPHAEVLHQTREREMVMAGDVQVIANAKKSARKLKGMHKLKEVSACCLSCAVLTLGAWVGASGRKRVTVPAAA